MAVKRTPASVFLDPGEIQKLGVTGAAVAALRDLPSDS